MAELSTETLQEIDPYDFEEFVADLWRLDGWTTEVSTRSGDRGRDVVATKRGTVDQKQIIECKRYSRPVGPSKVREYAGVRARETDADQVIIVTSSRFTKGAKQEARDLNVKLVNGEDLLEMIERLGAEDVLDDHVPQGGDTEKTVIELGDQFPDIPVRYVLMVFLGFVALSGSGALSTASSSGEQSGLAVLIGVSGLAYLIHREIKQELEDDNGTDER